MVRADETVTNLADLLALHREAIAAAQVRQALELPGTHYGTAPLDDLRAFTFQAIDAMISDIRTQSDESLEQYALDVGRRRLSLGFDISEVIEAILLFKEIVLPLIWQNIEPGSPEAYQAIRELDTRVRHTVARFGHLYAEMLQRQVRDQQRQRDLMLDASELTSRPLVPGEAMRQLATWLVTAVGATSCDIYMLDEDNTPRPSQIEAGHLTAVGGDSPGIRALNPELLPLVREALIQRQPRVAEVVESNIPVSPEGEQSPGLMRVLVLPLQQASQAFGVALVRADDKQPDFAPQAVELAFGITQAVTLAMVNARLYRLTRQHLVESKSLQRVMTALVEKLSLEAIFEIVCGEAQALAGAKGSAIFLVEEGVWLRNVISVGEVAFAVERVPIQGSFNGFVVRRGEALLSNNPAAESHRFMAASGATSVLVVPLRAKGTVIGALNIVNKPGGFADDDVRLMTLFADQAAIAIENARLSQRLEQLAVVEERQRLARDLHDSVTQTLYSVTLYADAALWSLEAGDTNAAGAHIREVQSSSREALREMRLLIFELHPPELEIEGLVAVLQSRLEAVEARAGFKADFRVEGERRLPLAVEESLYRIAQEALNNVFKHARAHQVTVALTFSDGGVSLEVCDDGIGFDPAAPPSQGGLGLGNMAERARKIRGTLQVDSAPGKGTRVHVMVNIHDLPS